MHADHDTDRGFSLLEIMTVLVVIGILVAIAIPVYTSSTARVERMACVSNQRVLTGAIEQYRIDHDSADPETVHDLVPYVSHDTVVFCPVDPSYGLVLLADHSRVVCENEDHND